MKKSDFYFNLPEELIASYPLKNRSASRLLVYKRAEDSLEHKSFRNLTEFLKPGDLLVFNNTKVIPARFFGIKESGGKVEFLVERLLDGSTFLSHIKASKAPKAGQELLLSGGYRVKILAKESDLYRCQLAGIEQVLEELGQIPLPHYMNRVAEELDKERYQTVYAKQKGSVAAPTAGLHFDENLLREIKLKGVNLAYITLHVGAGTFRPVRTENIDEHTMHSELCTISQETCDQINQTKAKGGRIIAVGTTSLRSLETVAKDGILTPFQGETNIFIKPGYKFKICDALLTNFHLPESTLIMLVSAFVGHKKALEIYQKAIDESYRFFSYGDASLFL